MHTIFVPTSMVFIKLSILKTMYQDKCALLDTKFATLKKKTSAVVKALMMEVASSSKDVGEEENGQLRKEEDIADSRRSSSSAVRPSPLRSKRTSDASRWGLPDAR